MLISDYFQALTNIISQGFFATINYNIAVFGGGFVVFVILEKTLFSLNNKND